MKLRYGILFFSLVTNLLVLSNEIPKPKEDKRGCWLPGYPSELPQRMCKRVKDFQEHIKSGKPFPAGEEKMMLLWGEEGKSTDDLLLAARAAAQATGMPIIEVDARKDLKKARENGVFINAHHYYVQAEKVSHEKKSPVLIIVKNAHVFKPTGFKSFLGTYQAEFDIQKRKETPYFTLIVVDHVRHISESLWSRFGGGNHCEIRRPNCAERSRLIKERVPVSALGASLLTIFTYGSSRKDIVDKMEALTTGNGTEIISSLSVARALLSDNQKRTVYASNTLVTALTCFLAYKYGTPYIVKLLQKLRARQQQTAPNPKR